MNKSLLWKNISLMRRVSLPLPPELSISLLQILKNCSHYIFQEKKCITLFMH